MGSFSFDSEVFRTSTTLRFWCLLYCWDDYIQSHSADLSSFTRLLVCLAFDGRVSSIPENWRCIICSRWRHSCGRPSAVWITPRKRSKLFDVNKQIQSTSYFYRYETINKNQVTSLLRSVRSAGYWVYGLLFATDTTADIGTNSMSETSNADTHKNKIFGLTWTDPKS